MAVQFDGTLAMGGFDAPPPPLPDGMSIEK
jgi:hypothetical protein